MTEKNNQKLIEYGKEHLRNEMQGFIEGATCGFQLARLDRNWSPQKDIPYKKSMLKNAEEKLEEMKELGMDTKIYVNKINEIKKQYQK